MTAINRRSFMATSAAAVVVPAIADAKECKSYDWETMSLEARNLAFNNVAHVTPEFARTSGISIPHPIPRHPALFTFMAATGSGGTRRYSVVSPRVFSLGAGRRRCQATL